MGSFGTNLTTEACRLGYLLMCAHHLRKGTSWARQMTQRLCTLEENILDTRGSYKDVSVLNMEVTCLGTKG